MDVDQNKHKDAYLWIWSAIHICVRTSVFFAGVARYDLYLLRGSKLIKRLQQRGIQGASDHAWALWNSGTAHPKTGLWCNYKYSQSFSESHQLWTAAGNHPAGSNKSAGDLLLLIPPAVLLQLVSEVCKALCANYQTSQSDHTRD